MKRVGLLGASAIDNTGDLLLALATRQALRARADVEVVMLSPRWPQATWRQDFTTARGLGQEILPVSAEEPLSSHRLDAVIVSGGVIGLDPLFRPFLVEELEGAAAWSAVCSQNTPWWLDEHKPRYALIADACRRLAYVSVRNGSTERFLRHCGFRGKIALAADPVFRLDVPAPAKSAAAPARPLVGWSVGNALASPRAAEFHRDLIAVLRPLVAAGTIELVLFPFGAVYGDEQLTAQLAAQLPGARVLPPMPPLECWQLVGTLSFYICTRFHALIAALSLDVPFLVCDEYLDDEVATSKIRELVTQLSLEPFYTAPLVGRNPSRRLQRLLGWTSAGRVTFKPLVAQLRRDVDKHFDAMCDALGLRG